MANRSMYEVNEKPIIDLMVPEKILTSLEKNRAINKSQINKVLECKGKIDKNLCLVGMLAKNTIHEEIFIKALQDSNCSNHTTLLNILRPNENTRLKEVISDHEERITLMEKEKEELRKTKVNIDEVMKERDELKRERDELKRERDNLQREMVELKREMEELKEDHEEQKVENYELKRKLEEKEKEFEEASKEINYLKDRIKKLEQEIGKLREYNESAHSKIKAMEDCHEKEREETQTQMSELKEEIVESKKLIDNLKKKCEEKDEEIDGRLSWLMNEMSRQKTETKHQITAQQEKIAQLQRKQNLKPKTESTEKIVPQNRFTNQRRK